MTDTFKNTLLWLIGSTAAFICAMQWLPATWVDGQYLPVGHDAFYHARRILDAVASGSVTQFDPRIHAPEGSWLTWPWAYDLGMAWLARLGMAIGLGEHPMSILAYVPAAWVYINGALLLAITVVLGLPIGLRAVAMACFALSPLTQLLHGVGALDHHYVEYTFVLLTLLTGMMWMQQPASMGRAAAIAGALALGTAFHNSLFILQVPVLLALAVTWIKHAPPCPAGRQ